MLFISIQTLGQQAPPEIGNWRARMKTIQNYFHEETIDLSLGECNEFQKEQMENFWIKRIGKEARAEAASW